MRHHLNEIGCKVRALLRWFGSNAGGGVAMGASFAAMPLFPDFTAGALASARFKTKYLSK